MKDPCKKCKDNAICRGMACFEKLEYNMRKSLRPRGKYFVIRKYDGYCLKKCKTFPFGCTIDCEHYPYEKGITYLQAIRKMEKAMKQYAADEGICTDRDMAKVALMALLDY